MGSIKGRTGWFRHSIAFAAAAVVAGFQLFSSPVFAGYELPPGERITNLPAIPRNMLQKEAYENYDPVIGRNFDLKNFWMPRRHARATGVAERRLFRRVIRQTAFGGCNTQESAPGATTGRRTARTTLLSKQWARLGIGYDLSPDVNFYVGIDLLS